MTEQVFRVQQIDHVEIFVEDQYAAAQWYRDVLGMEIMPEFEFWAAEGGPLMVSSDGGSTKLALFKQRPGQSFLCKRIAFRVDGAGFLAFLKRLDTLEIQTDSGTRLTADGVVDHDKAFSIYFRDPDDNLFEITTYDETVVRAGL